MSPRWFPGNCCPFLPQACLAFCQDLSMEQSHCQNSGNNFVVFNSDYFYNFPFTLNCSQDEFKCTDACQSFGRKSNILRVGSDVEGRRVGWLDRGLFVDKPSVTNIPRSYTRQIPTEGGRKKTLMKRYGNRAQWMLANSWHHPRDRMIDVKICCTGFVPTPIHIHHLKPFFILGHFYPSATVGGIMIVTDYHTDSTTIIQGSFYLSEKCHFRLYESYLLKSKIF